MIKEDVIKAMNGNQNAYETIMLENYRLIHRYVASKIGNLHDREDVTQEILLIVYSKIHTLKKPDAFKPWLISIMRNCCNKWYIEKSKKPIPIDAEDLRTVLCICQVNWGPQF